jgi:hypothetical protein
MNDNKKHCDLHDLEARVSRGDAGAEGELLSRLEPQMVCMVRRALRSKPSASPLDRIIRAEIRRLTPWQQEQPALEERGLVRQVAQRVCAAVIDRLRPTRPDPRNIHDTIPAGRINYQFRPRMERMKTVLSPEECN